MHAAAKIEKRERDEGPYMYRKSTHTHIDRCTLTVVHGKEKGSLVIPHREGHSVEEVGHQGSH